MEEKKVGIEKVGRIVCMMYVRLILCMYKLLDLGPPGALQSRGVMKKEKII